MLELILFYTFAVIAVVSAILVITQRNVVHSAVALAGTLLSVAGIFLTLHAEFLAGVQVIVYVGGILVLFVFVIMLIALERSLHERQFHRQGRIALVISMVLIAEFAYGLLRGRNMFPPIPAETPAQGLNLTQNTQAVGQVLYQNYLLPFEIASILLLVAIVGAVALAKRKTEAEE
jgi:NADH-quinone oxidoreductase subunit J